MKTVHTRIVIVEDDPLIASSLKLTLGRMDYEVVAMVSSGEAAVRHICDDPPDAVLMDIKLAGSMDGIETAEQIQRIHDLPIIYLTAYADRSLLERAKLSEPFGYLLKPFQQKELQITLEMALYKHNIAKQLSKSEHDLKMTLDATTDGIWTWDFASDELSFSPKYYTMLGYEPDEFPASYEHWENLIHPNDREHALQTASEWLKAKPDVYENEYRLQKKTGEYRWIHSRGKVVERDEKGNALRMIGNHEDVTERKRAEEELRQSREQLRKLTARLAELEETERRRLARELHDQVGQNLTTLSIHTNILRSQFPPELRAKVNDRFDDAQTLLEETTEAIRNVMADLRPSILDDYGLFAALRWYGELFEKRSGIPVTVQGTEPASRLPMTVETALFRILQEALTNIVKHAEAKQITLSLDSGHEKCMLAVVDDGKGFEPATSSGGGYGLLGMRERALSVGGQVEIVSSLGSGTTILVEV